MLDERRRYVRKRVDLAATFQEAEGDLHEATVSDMSLGGAFVETADKLPFGTVVTLTVALPKGELRVDATVRWHKPAGMGVQFGALRAKDTFLVTEYLATLEPLPDSRRF